MINRAEALIYVIIFLLIFSVGLAGFYFISYKYEKKTRIEIEEQLDSLNIKKEKIEKELKKINEDMIILEEDLKEKEELIPELEKNLEQVTQAKELLMNEQERIEKEISKAKKESEEAREALREKLQEVTDLKNRLNVAILERDDLRTKISRLALARDKTENLDKIIVTSSDVNDEIRAHKPPLVTEVLSVNQEYKFLVLNVGLPDGVALGDIFEIFHNDILIGRVRVEKVHDTLSAADFLNGFKKSKVREGDVAARVN